MRIRVEPNEDFIVELREIQKEVNMLHGGIEDQIRQLQHQFAILIDTLIDAEEVQ